MCVQELVSEKLRTQQMNNDLEKLTHELEKIGLNKERLLHDESSDDRYGLTNVHTALFLLSHDSFQFRTTIETALLHIH